MPATFGFFSDPGLTTPITQLAGVQQFADAGNTAADKLVYFGSTASLKWVRSAANPGAENILVSPVNTIVARANSTVYAVGDYVVPTVWNGYKYRCTTGGTSGGAPPTYSTVVGQTTADGTVVWTTEKAHPTTEIKLAGTLLGLDSAVAGAALSLGAAVFSGVGDAKPIYLRILDSTGIAGSTTELAIQTQSLVETASP